MESSGFDQFFLLSLVPMSACRADQNREYPRDVLGLSRITCASTASSNASASISVSPRGLVILACGVVKKNSFTGRNTDQNAGYAAQAFEHHLTICQGCADPSQTFGIFFSSSWTVWSFFRSGWGPVSPAILFPAEASSFFL